MAGTIVADTLQNGAGTSTSMDNAINGSAKAWVRFQGSSSVATINASYNVSSVSVTATGFFVVNFTTALADANFATFVNKKLNSSGGTTSSDADLTALTNTTASASSISVFDRTSNPVVYNVVCFR
jgi:hypothetical protein